MSEVPRKKMMHGALADAENATADIHRFFFPRGGFRLEELYTLPKRLILFFSKTNIQSDEETRGWGVRNKLFCSNEIAVLTIFSLYLSPKNTDFGQTEDAIRRRNPWVGCT